MAVHYGRSIACTCFIVLYIVSFQVAAQDSSSSDAASESNGPSPEYKAATVVTNLWLGAFAVTSAVFGVLGAIVAIQWPNPRIFCYKTSYSDMPSSSGRSCCSLYSLNLGFCVFWLLVFAIMVIARDLLRIIVCLSFALGHVLIIVSFRMKFKRYGRPERPHRSAATVTSSSNPTVPAMLGPNQALGIPIYNIPMQTVVIGGPANGNGNSSGATGQSSSYWYDAACIPPQQQPGMFEMQPQNLGAAPAAGPYASGQSVAYPPQPPAYAAYASYPSGPQAAGTAVGLVVQPAATGAAGARAAPGQAVGAPQAGNSLAAQQQTGSRR